MNEICTMQTDARIQLATFYIDEMLIGLELDFVKEINKDIALTEVPRSPDFVRGVINLRGNIVTVIDLRTILGLGRTEINKNTNMVIVNSDNEQIALLVDKVAGVICARPDLLENPPANLDEIEVQYFKYIYKTETELLMVLDINAILDIGVERPESEQNKNLEIKL